MTNGHPFLAPPVIPAYAVCKLISTTQNPWLWRVEVLAMEGRHKGTKRTYEVPGIHEQAAAQLGMETFSKELFLRGMNA